MELRYETKFWQGLPIITSNIIKKNRELTFMNYAFSEYSAIEADFSKGLDRLSSFKLDYDETSTYGQGIAFFFSLIKQESVIHMQKSEMISKTIRSNFEKGLSVLKKETDNNLKDFNSNEEKFFKTLRDLEALRIKFHSLIKQVDQEKLNDFIQNSCPSMKTFSDEQSNKITSTIQNAIAKATEVKQNYISSIANANTAREYYISTANRIFKTLQLNDTKLIEFFKETLKSIVNENRKYYNDISDFYSNCEGINNIDANKDIEDFIYKNQTKGYEPFPVEFVPYSHQNDVLPVDVSSMTVQEQETCNESRLLLMNTFKLDEADQKADWPQIENYAKLSFEGQLPPSDKNALLKLFNKETNQRCYLNYLNQARTKGRYIISDQAYTVIGELMNGILDNIDNGKDIKDINYALVQYCIIISQTYGKAAQNFSDDKILVQNEIKTNKIWKKIEIWRNLIKSAIYTQLNITNNHSDYCQGFTSDKNDIIEKSAFSNIFTYADTLKSFCFQIKEIMEILHPLCDLYKIDEAMVEEVCKRDETDDGISGQRSSFKNIMNSIRLSNNNANNDEQKNIEQFDNGNEENGKFNVKKIDAEEKDEDNEEFQHQNEEKREEGVKEEEENIDNDNE